MQDNKVIEALKRAYNEGWCGGYDEGYDDKTYHTERGEGITFMMGICYDESDTRALIEELEAGDA